MSKTYNSDLQSNNERIQALINKANSLPEAGGNSVDTCTVNLTRKTDSYYGCTLFIEEDGVCSNFTGNISTLLDPPTLTTTELISNVICGSLLVIFNTSLTAQLSHTSSIGAEFLASSSGNFHLCYQITAGAGETATIITS